MTGFAEPRTICAAVVALSLALSATARVAVAQTNQTPAGAPAEPAAPAAPSGTPAIPPQPPPPAAFQPGFLHELKVWWDNSTGFIDQKVKETGSAIGDLGKKSGDATSGAADAAKGAAQSAATATQNAATATQTAVKGAVDATKSAASGAQDAMKGAVDATKGAAASAEDAMKGAVEITKNAATALVKLPGTRVLDVHERCAKAPNGASDCETAAATACRGKGFAGGRPLDVRTMEKCDASVLANGQIAGQHDCPVETVVTRAVCQ